MSSTISNSNYYSVSASSNNGVAGLVSGMDTDSMVKKMLSGTQSKIDTKKQEKQQLEWKQEQYQDVIESINGFSSKYFDTSYGSTLSTNLANTDLFNSMVSSITSGSSVKLVSTGTSANTGTTTINVTELASAAKLQSGVKMSGDQTITGKGMDVDAIKSRIEAGEDFTFDLTLDGVKKTVTLNSSDFEDGATLDASTIATALQKETKKAFGDYVGFTAAESDGKTIISIGIGDGLKTGGAIENGHELTITGADANYLGITAGSSTLVSGQTKLGAFAGATGDTFKFSINGTDFEFSADTTVSKMMNTINNSDAGVRMSYSSMTDSFAIEQSSTGAGFDIELEQNSGNLLSVMFGSDVISQGSVAESKTLNTSSITASPVGSYATSSTAMKMNVNGTDYTFTLAAKSSGSYTEEEVKDALNTWLADKFGKTGETANISFDGTKLNTAAGYSVSFAKSSGAASSDLAVALGFSTSTGGLSNAVTADTLVNDIPALSGLGIADGTKLSEITSISYQDGANTVSANVKYENGRLQLTDAGTYNFSGNSAANVALSNLFGSSVTVGTGAQGANTVTAGTDAEVVINGVATTRSSNTFTFDGITITATDKGETVIGTTRDVDKIVDVIKSFVSDYNTLIKDLYSRTTQDADYRNYKPLTSDQEDEMSDKEIELWTEKAQKGLLRGDTDINSFIDAMRSAVYTKSDSAGIALYSIGIESESWNGAGELVIDENMLRTAVEADPETIAALFTDKTNGVAATLSKACDTAAKVSSANTGALVVKAGAKNFTAGAKNNDIYWDLSRIDDRLDYLNDLYQSEKTRYWQQFSSMETIMQSYSSQSAMLTNMFS